VIPLLLVSVVWYAVITSVLNVAQYYIERHYARGSAQQLPPSPTERLRRWLAPRRPNPVPTRIDAAAAARNRERVAVTTGPTAVTSGDANAPFTNSAATNTTLTNREDLA
jgi:polar amino acid transport system permease protein